MADDNVESGVGVVQRHDNTFINEMKSNRNLKGPSDVGLLKPVIFATCLFTLVCVGLNSAILAKGLRGESNPTDNGTIEATALEANGGSVTASGGQPVATDGVCLVDVRLQEDGETVVGVPPWHPDNNVIVRLAGSECDVGVSPTWTVAEWDYTIVQLAPNAIFNPPAVGDDERQLVKVIQGSVLDINLNGVFTNGHWESYVVTVPNRAVPLFIDNSVDAIPAGENGAVIIYMKVSEQSLNTPFTDMAAAPATTIGGPFSEHFQWRNFGEIYPDPFEGVEFWNLGAINIQNHDGTRLHNMQWWSFREDFDVDGYHDHSDLTGDNAFGEVHMTTHVPNSVTGMQTTLPGTENLNVVNNPENPGNEAHKYNQNDSEGVQLAIPLPPGSAHGPLWSVDPATGEPTLLCSGAIQYPFHRMIVQANGPPNSPLRYVSWVAFEHPPADVRVPLKMLTEWPNAYLQSTMSAAECNADGSVEDAEAYWARSRNQPEVTGGVCEMEVSLQAEGETSEHLQRRALKSRVSGNMVNHQEAREIPVGVPVDWHPDNNIIVKLADSACGVGVSPTWTIADWDYTVVQIEPNASFRPPKVEDDQRQLVKIIRGTLIDVNVNGIFTNGHWETYVVTSPNRAIPMFIDNSIDSITAGEDGAVIIYIKVSENVLNTPLTDMTSAPATIVAGPYSENLQWVNFGNYFSDFEGVEFYNMAGILLQENDGSRLSYIQFWTLREDEGADGYHDHSNLNEDNAFGEIHMAMYAANGVSGMQTTLPGTENLNHEANPDTIELDEAHAYNNNDQTEVQIAIPMPPGFAHGPLWSVNPSTGEPTYLCSGGIQYPSHRWLIQSNGQPNSPLRYSMWAAFEHVPKDVTVPTKMLTEWPNAYLQTTLTEAECDAASRN